jgi:hypothetical protein
MRQEQSQRRCGDFGTVASTLPSPALPPLTSRLCVANSSIAPKSIPSECRQCNSSCAKFVRPPTPALRTAQVLASALSSLLSAATAEVLKATADLAGANKLYGTATAVGADMLALRGIVMAKKQPRPMFVQVKSTLSLLSHSLPCASLFAVGCMRGQAHTYLAANGEVQLQEFAPTHEGVIESFVTRFGAQK